MFLQQGLFGSLGSPHLESARKVEAPVHATATAATDDEEFEDGEDYHHPTLYNHVVKKMGTT